VPRSARFIWAVATLRNQARPPVPFDRRRGIDEYPIRRTCQQPHQLALRIESGTAQIVAIHCEQIEGAELDLLILPAGVQCLEVGDAIDTRTTASPSITNLVGCQTLLSQH